MPKRVGEIRSLMTSKPSIVKESCTLAEVAKKIVEDARTRTVYVVNDDEVLTGIIPVMELIQYIYYRSIPQEYVLYRFPILLSTSPTAKDIMLSPVYVRDEDDVEDALIKMFKNRLEEIPVVDERLHVTGNLSILELIVAHIESDKNAD